MQSITIRRPDDFHVHLRQGDMLKKVVPETARHFARALVMPNTDPPILNGGHVRAYREEILAAVPEGVRFEPLMTVKLTGAATPEIVKHAKEAGAIAGKLYPQSGTHNSDDGVSDVRAMFPVFKAMEAGGMVLCLHGEVADPDVDCMDSEGAFLPMLAEIAATFPRLKIVLEHVSTAEAVEAVKSLDDNVAATVTVHHLLLTHNDVVRGRLRPHNFCMPIAKRKHDREALLKAVTSGNPKFFLGTDSAPHAKERKECAEGCAGVYVPSAVGLAALATIYDRLDRLEMHFQDFVSNYGSRFYGLPLTQETITLERREFPVPRSYPGNVIPFLAGTTLPWSVVD